MTTKEVDTRDLTYVYEAVCDIRAALLQQYINGRDVPDPYKLDGPCEILRDLLGIEDEEDDSDEQAELDSLELRFDDDE